MKLMIVQLSDIHLAVEKWPNNPILQRTAKIKAQSKVFFLMTYPRACCLLTGTLLMPVYRLNTIWE